MKALITVLLWSAEIVELLIMPTAGNILVVVPSTVAIVVVQKSVLPKELTLAVGKCV